MKHIEIKDYHRHPCFNPEVKGKFGRVHLPVAPKCNIKCNFCDRKYDCVNESRPGVTSTVLNPAQAELYMDKVLEAEPRITVAGIAGPGDPFANGPETMETLRRIRKQHPATILCLSSNGMGIGPYIPELATLGVSHVTITVCAVDPEIGEKIYAWVSDDKVIYRGRQGAELLLSRQLAAIKSLKEHGIAVKINCIVIPGINDHHVEDVARTVRDLGADLLNCMALFPNANTPFGHLEQPSKEEINEIRNMAEQYLPQMRHCARCRSDAVGLLGQDRSNEFRGCLSEMAATKVSPEQLRPYVAVATQEGILVNQHLGEATSFQIWDRDGDTFKKIATREAPDAGGGIKRWHKLARILPDCQAVLVSGIGETPSDILTKSGIKPVEAAGFIEEALETVFSGGYTGSLKGRRKSCATGGCQGGGGGCG